MNLDLTHQDLPVCNLPCREGGCPSQIIPPECALDQSGGQADLPFIGKEPEVDVFIMSLEGKLVLICTLMVLLVNVVFRRKQYTEYTVYHHFKATRSIPIMALFFRTESHMDWCRRNQLNHYLYTDKDKFNFLLLPLYQSASLKSGASNFGHELNRVKMTIMLTGL